MKLIISEKRVLEYLTNNGATTKHELMVVTGYSRCTVGNAIRTLIAAKRVAKHDLRKVQGHKQRQPTFVVVAEAPEPTPTIETVNVFEHPEIYTRLNALDGTVARLEKVCAKLREDLNELSKDEVANYDRLNKAVKTLNTLELHRIRIDDAIGADRSRMDGFAARLTALEPKPAVDPIYAEIERDITETLGGKYSPELLRALIDSAYAERAK